MNTKAALAMVRSLAAAGLVIVTIHAEREMRDLGVLFADLVYALAHAQRCTWQPAQGTWKVKGADRFGVTMVVAVDIQESVVVVTVFD